MTDELRDDRVYRLDLGNVSAYLVDDGDVTLIDAGMPNATETIRAELAEAGYGEGDLDRVLITHFDVDHVGTLAHLDFDAPIYALEPDASYLDGTRKTPLSNHKGIMQRLFGLWLARPDAEIHRVGGEGTVGDFVAYHTPGHTPGHGVFVHGELGVAFVGDLVTNGNGGLDTPPWIMSYSAAENARSVRELAARDLGVETLAMGHGRPIEEEGAAVLAHFAATLE